MHHINAKFVAMRKRDEVRELHEEFYHGFGQRMKRHEGADGTRVRWATYRSGLRDVYFRLEANGKVARVCIDIQHKDEGIRALFFEQFQEFRMLLEDALGPGVEWEERHFLRSGAEVARIGVTLGGLNLYDRMHWSKLWDFFEEKMLALDEFWVDVREVFYALNG